MGQQQQQQQQFCPCLSMVVFCASRGARSCVAILVVRKMFGLFSLPSTYIYILNSTASTSFTVGVTLCVLLLLLCHSLSLGVESSIVSFKTTHGFKAIADWKRRNLLSSHVCVHCTNCSSQFFFSFFFNTFTDLHEI